MANGKNAYMGKEIEGLAVFGDYTTPTANKDKIQALIDLIEPEHTQKHRGHLDMISTPAHRQLIKELTALKAAVANLA